ncbi:hypothetical protein B0H11DRAFT_2316011 [Mycena galericulata]|nr:hypothetical protein B0H11DRAFT_2316011 [Mycena galericulata]
MDNFSSGSSSPASSSFYGDSFPTLSSDLLHRSFGVQDHTQWNQMRSSSPANLPPASSSRSSGPLFQNHLELQLQKAESTNSLLRVENAAIKAAYHELVCAVPALLAATSNPFNLPINDSGMAFPALPELSRADYPLVKYWHRNDFAPQGSDGVSNNGVPNPRGGRPAAQGVNVSGKYIETEDGEVVNGFRVTAMGKTAAQIWFGFVALGIAPPSWGQAGLRAITLYNNEMCGVHPELRLCAGNWKAQCLAKINYSSWHRSHGSGDAPAKRKRSTKSGAGPPATEVRKKIKLDDSDMLVINPLWEPDPSSNLPEIMQAAPGQQSEVRGPGTSDTSADDIDDPASLAVLPHATPTVTSDAFPIPIPAAAAAAHATNTSADVPTPVPALAYAMTASLVSTPTATNAITVISDASAIDQSTGPAPASIPQTTSGEAARLAPASDPTAAAARAALIKTAFPSQIAAPKSPPVATPPAPTAFVSVAQGPKMTATNSLTARNLCAQDWIKRTKGTRAAFALYWDSIRGTAEETRWNTDSRKAKACATENAALATA